ncbi:hypothetical protein [Ekhidna sp.]|uniref:HYC_CC_PP family protein n=1 Tax=Ekhidna sp. TaxID=2608089 RepID=UPI003298B1AC
MKKIISISLAIILLLGNVGFTYGTHFCMGMAMKSELMLGQEHMDCGMGTMDHPDHEDEKMHFVAPDCCENEYVTLKTDELFKKDISTELAQIFVTSTIAGFLYEINLEFNQHQPILVDSYPPLPDLDFQVLYQAFLI